jgi:hypothetical protein
VFRYNFPCLLDTNREFTIDMPVGSKILNAKIKPFDPNASIWALVPVVENPFIEHRRFLILGTGHKYETDKKLQHIDIIFEQRDDNPDDSWVWHIFEII